MVHGGRGDLMAHAQKLAEPELKQEQGLVTTLLLLVMAPHVQDPQVMTQIVTLNHVQLMECGQTGGLGEPAPLRAGEVIRTAPGTAPIRNHSTGALTVSGTPRTRPRPVTPTLVLLTASGRPGDPGGTAPSRAVEGPSGGTGRAPTPPLNMAAATVWAIAQTPRKTATPRSA